jgi:pilus assembly protein FimV
LLLIGLLTWWWSNRRKAPLVETRRDTERLAAAVPVPRVADTDVETDPDSEGAFEADENPAQAEAMPAEPAWNRLVKPAEPEPQPPVPPVRGVPTWHAGGFEVGPLNPAPPGQGRLDLARAYLEMGDRDTARSLLQEVATRGDTVDVRRQAEDMLRELG